jgi:hypothetical protein
MPQPPAPLRRVVARQAIVALPHPLLLNKRDNLYTTSCVTWDMAASLRQ